MEDTRWPNTRPPARVRIGGMLVGYHAVCPRKAWYAMRGIWMEQESEAVALGRLLDRTSYRRRRRPALVTAEAPDGTPLVAKIDGADLRAGVLHETKKGRAEEGAHRLQLRFYLWVLKRSGVTRSDGAPLTGRLDYPALRRSEAVTLEPEHEAALAETVAALAGLARHETPPERHPRRSFCRRCAYESLCYG
ncbi:MAG: CRISPR-associated protein Cas4 [Rhodothermales bacterium]|nr:CRISPR-associated protein Cas4 [Rhodothermales bacterium]